MLSSAIAKTKLAPRVLLPLISLVSLALVAIGSYAHAYQYRYLYLQESRFSVQIARTPEERARGLSGVKLLAKDQGMLFVYDHPVVSCFWMHDMHFSIDMIWVSQNLKVLALQPRVSPSSYPHLFCTPIPARYGLEVPSGTTYELDVRVGDTLHF